MRTRNLTIGGLAQAKAVTKPKITGVIDLDTGADLGAVQFIEGHRHQALIAVRNTLLERMQDEKPHFVCSLCTTPVYLVATPEKHFFFRHRVEDGSCPAQTRHPLTEEEIRQRKYHGLRESAPHKRIKELIERSLQADPAYSAIAQEKTWRSLHDPAAYRRPDVQADSALGKLAFEVQLSTTFLSVVVGRRIFYRDEGALLVWIFGGFDPAYRRLMTDDVLFPNNSNLFVVDEETATISETQGQFHLRCHYRAPLREGNTVKDEWREEIVAFTGLKQDRPGQRIYAFDYEGEEVALRERIFTELAQAKAEIERIDRADFFEFWREHGRGFKHTPENRANWFQLRARMMRHGVTMPDFPDTDGEVRAVTRKPTKALEIEARGQLDLDRGLDYAGYTAFGLIGTRQDRFYVQASYARTFRDHWDLPGSFVPTANEDGGARDFSRTEDWRVNVKAGFTPNATDEYAISYTRQEGSKNAPLHISDDIIPPLVAGSPPVRFWTWPFWNLDSVYFLSTTALGNVATLKTRIYRNRFENLLQTFDDRSQTTQTLGRSFNSFYEDEAYGGSAELAVAISAANTLTIAAHYRRDEHVEFQQSFPSGFVEPRQTNVEDTWSIAAENRLALAPTLAFTAGVSFDWRDLRRAEEFGTPPGGGAAALFSYPTRNASAFNGQGRLDWTPDDVTRLYASI